MSAGPNSVYFSVQTTPEAKDTIDAYVEAQRAAGNWVTRNSLINEFMRHPELIERAAAD